MTVTRSHCRLCGLLGRVAEMRDAIVPVIDHRSSTVALGTPRDRRRWVCADASACAVRQREGAA